MKADPSTHEHSMPAGLPAKEPYSILDQYFAATVVVAISLSTAVVIWELHRMSNAIVEDSAVNDASAYNEAIAEFRTLYTSEVVDRVNHTDISVSHDYLRDDTTIPLPATFTKILGARLGNTESRCSTNLYSDYPFPWRKDGGPRDEFERQALASLRERPDQPYYRFEEFEGKRVIRYATADRMRASCVQCHNTHPESPKTDWSEGDVRGVLAITMPMDAVVSQTRSKLNATLIVFGLVGSVVVSLFAFITIRLRRQAEKTRHANVSLANQALQLAKTTEKAKQANQQLTTNSNKLSRSRKAALNLMQDMRQAKDIAEAAVEAKSQFLANMSHEIRTPLTAMLGFADVLLGEQGLEKAPPERVESFSTIRRNGEHLLHVINDILDLSKIEAGKFQIEQIAFSPHELLRDVRQLMQVKADAKGLKWHVELDGALPIKVQSDPTRLRQILINLVGNAIKFTEVGSVKLIARCSVKDNQAKLIFNIIDTGIGIPHQQQAKLFLPFQQADNSMSRKFGGTGLGLTISKRFTELLGGDIKFVSKQGKGSTFTVSVDVGRIDGVEKSDQLESALATTAPQANSNSPSDEDKPLKNLKVLLVEDGPDNQRLISFILKKAGSAVTVADNGKIGYDLALAAIAEGNAFDVVLTDMQMPVMDGYTTTRELRQQGYEGPIIALTAHAMAEDRQKCLDAGCNDFATKPIDRKQIVELVYKHANTSNLAKLR